MLQFVYNAATMLPAGGRQHRADLRETTFLRFDSFLQAEGKHFSAPPLNMLNKVQILYINAWTPTEGKLERQL